MRQGQIVVTISGNAGLWQDWTKDQVRDFIFQRARRTVAELKQAEVLAGDPEPGDESAAVSLIPDPSDILLVFAGGEEANMSSVILVGGQGGQHSRDQGDKLTGTTVGPVYPIPGWSNPTVRRERWSRLTSTSWSTR